MLRAYKYRIYPTEEQRVLLAKTFGCCRYVYNWCLEQNEKIYKETGKNVSRVDMIAKVRNELRKGSAPWMKEVSAKALEFAVIDLYDGYKNYFDGRSNLPKFKHKFNRQSYHDCGNTKGAGLYVNFKNETITIPKIKDIPCVFHRKFFGRIKQVCVEMLPSAIYRVSLLVDDGLAMPTPPPVSPNSALGIDTGLDHLAVLSDGQVYESKKYGRKEKRKLKILSRQFRKKKIGSRQFRILKHRIAKLQEHVANKRHDHLHKITHQIACENQATTICVESLNIEGMKRCKFLSYSMDDACLGEFYRQLEYKCKWYGKNYVKIGRFAPSSRMCSNCGYVNKEWSLNIREWTCPECGTHHDRDLNAAINIKNFGLGLNEALPSVRGKVKPVEQPLVDDRSSEPKKLHCCYTARRVRADEAGKVTGDVAQMPDVFSPE